MVDGWTIATAIGTTASALFVSWQAYETRRATNTSRRALQASQAVAIEEVRARMDATAPKVDVHLHTPTWPPLEPSVAEDRGGQAQLMDPWREWHFPRDADHELRMQVQVSFSNVGDRSVHMRIEGGLRDTDGRPIVSERLAAGAEVTRLFEVTYTVAEWATNWEAQQKGDLWPHLGEALVSCSDDGDTGVEDRWHLRLSGAPIRPAPDRDGIWQFSPEPDGTSQSSSMQFAPHPIRQRTYWLSQVGRVELPHPTFE